MSFSMQVKEELLKQISPQDIAVLLRQLQLYGYAVNIVIKSHRADILKLVPKT